jgi:flagella basal body P-ring formation protein FlgA
MVRMKCFATLGAVLSCLVAGCPAWGQNRASALERRVAEATFHDLHLDSEVPATIQILASPNLSLPAQVKLHVVSVGRGFSPGSRLVRLDCSTRSDCLPFHVVLRSAALERSDLTGTGRMSEASTRRSLQKDAKSLGQFPPPLARSGDRMLLVEQRPGMRLQAKVVCLQSGALGDAIRVRNLATHRVLLATVTGKAEVRVE